ncbi:Molecular chaperone (DnaJ superfamily) [Phaffia rhodozyma]|uniref:Molecular chaperone (DnaJ superfamily) n=1 Tax=Phaffia rhodozyma TaxID=264483 RepID=A0A0F7SMA8_PHARH|nr:Molecular chaperone (DnaJ superfamily) [Phaffia rhodozyma]
MAPGLGYDEQGSLANYFLITFITIALVPTTFFTFKSQLQPANVKALTDGLAVPESRQRASREKIFGKQKSKKKGISKKAIFLILGWSAFAFLAHRIHNSEAIENVIYNPFEILGITDSLTEKEIKRSYKKLSLKFHPDKYKLQENETQEDADAKFVEITKAYKALTDDVTRENWQLYGNPDGPQQREDVVAIPKWVIEGKNGSWVLAVYGLVIGGILPWLVGKWWFGTRQYTKDGTTNSTAATFFRRLDEMTSVSDLISILASASEFTSPASEASKKVAKDKKTIKAELGALEEAVRKRATELGLEGQNVDWEETGLGEVMGGRFDSLGNKRAGVLIWGHLLRIQWDSPSVREETAELLLSLPPLLASLLNISLSHHWFSTSLQIMHLQAYLAQATLPTLPNLLQLPHITFEQAQALESKVRSFRSVVGAGNGDRWVRAFNRIEKEKKKALLDEVKVTDNETERNEMDSVAKSWPKLEIVSAKFKVIGEKNIAPSSIVQCAFKLRLSNQTTSAVEPDAKKVEEDSDDEDESEAVKKAKDEALKKKTPLTAYTPYWPENRPLKFWAMIGDIKSDRVIVQPVFIPTIYLGETLSFSLQFQAPPNAGHYTFQATFLSNSVVGSEVRKGMLLIVDEPVAEAESEDDDISDPEEDSLAGQLAQMKGQRVKSSKLAGEDDDSSEEDSSSDEDGPRGKKGNDDSSSDSDSD